MTRKRYGVVAVLTSLALAIGGTVAVSAAPASAAGADASAVLAARFLAGQLKAHDYRMPASSGGDDWGLTIDALLGLASARVGGDVATQTFARIRANAYQYLASSTPDGDMGRYAKVALAFEVAGADPTAVDISQLPDRSAYDGAATIDLIALLRDSIDSASGQAGESWAFTQALVVIALARTDVGVPAKAVDYLKHYQCTTVGSAEYGGLGYSVSDPCGATSSYNRPDADTTALALSAFLAAGRTTADAGVSAISTWIAAHQSDSGSFADNANSTGLMAQALRQLGSPTRADKAETYLESLQVGCAGPFVLGAASEQVGGGFWSGWLGAVAYTSGHFVEGRSGAIADDRAGYWRRATAQAILGLDSGAAMKQLTLDGMSPGFPASSLCGLAGDAPTVTGLPRPGSVLTGTAGAFRTSEGSSTGQPNMVWSWTRDGVPVAGAVTSTYTVSTADAGSVLRAAVTAREPGFAELTLSSAAVQIPAVSFVVSSSAGWVYQGAPAPLQVSGMGAGEAYTATLGGVVIATGTASAGGTVKTTFTVPAGTATNSVNPLIVIGSSALRGGSTTIYTVGTAHFSVVASKYPVYRGGKTTVTANGLLPGEAFTVRLSNKKVAEGTASAAGRVSIVFTVSKKLGSASRALRMDGQFAGRSGSATLATAAPGKLTVKVSAKSVKRKKKQTIRVTKLLPFEALTVAVTGRSKLKGRATASGTFSCSFTVGTKKGTKKVTVHGMKNTRVGKASYKVK